jgi:hypothetical protein
VRITRDDARRLGLDFDALWRGGTPSPRAVAVPGEPRLVRADSGTGWWEAEWNDWRPSSKNLKVNRWKWHAARKRDNAAVSLWAAHLDGPPAAKEKRTVRLTVRRRKAAGRLPDQINLMESLSDSCVANGLLVDDSARWLAFPEPLVFVDRGIAADWATTIRLEEEG